MEKNITCCYQVDSKKNSPYFTGLMRKKGSSQNVNKNKIYSESQHAYACTSNTICKIYDRNNPLEVTSIAP